MVENNRQIRAGHAYLVGGFNPSEKILVSWDYHSQKTKPPTSYSLHILTLVTWL